MNITQLVPETDTTEDCFTFSQQPKFFNLTRQMLMLTAVS